MREEEFSKFKAQFFFIDESEGVYNLATARDPTYDMANAFSASDKRKDATKRVKKVKTPHGVETVIYDTAGVQLDPDYALADESTDQIYETADEHERKYDKAKKAAVEDEYALADTNGDPDAVYITADDVAQGGNGKGDPNYQMAEVDSPKYDRAMQSEGNYAMADDIYAMNPTRTYDRAAPSNVEYDRAGRRLSNDSRGHSIQIVPGKLGRTTQESDYALADDGEDRNATSDEPT